MSPGTRLDAEGTGADSREDLVGEPGPACENVWSVCTQFVEG